MKELKKTEQALLFYADKSYDPGIRVHSIVLRKSKGQSGNQNMFRWSSLRPERCLVTVV